MKSKKLKKYITAQEFCEMFKNTKIVNGLTIDGLYYDYILTPTGEIFKIESPDKYLHIEMTPNKNYAKRITLRNDCGIQSTFNAIKLFLFAFSHITLDDLLNIRTIGIFKDDDDTNFNLDNLDIKKEDNLYITSIKRINSLLDNFPSLRLLQSNSIADLIYIDGKTFIIPSLIAIINIKKLVIKIENAIGKEELKLLAEAPADIFLKKINSLLKKFGASGISSSSNTIHIMNKIIFYDRLYTRDANIYKLTINEIIDILNWLKMHNAIDDYTKYIKQFDDKKIYASAIFYFDDIIANKKEHIDLLIKILQDKDEFGETFEQNCAFWVKYNKILKEKGFSQEDIIKLIKIKPYSKFNRRRILRNINKCN